MRKVPLGLAGEVLYEEFSKWAPELLGDYTSQGEWLKFFTHTFTEVFQEGSAWVVITSDRGSHSAEVHAYAFDHIFSNKIDFFRRVVQVLAEEGKVRLWTSLMPRAGHGVRRMLRELGFACEGIMRSFYYLGADKGFADGELWARISHSQEAKRGEL